MSEPQVETSTLLEIYRRASLIFTADERFRADISSGQLQIVYYSPRGQEVLSAALMTALEPSDYLVTTYRGLHDQLAKGIPLRDLWAEFSGKSTGTCKGKGGPMHITHPETGVMVTTGIVGSGIPIANGLALASSIEKDGKVTVVCFGDGATNIGAFHEALNMAQIWSLPVIFVCQNNLYGEHTPQRMSTGVARLADRAAAYGMRGVQVNGNDAAAMYSVAREAAANARSGKGPTFIEARTFRFCGHLLGDDSHYIPTKEMDAAKAADPVPALRKQLEKLGIEASQLDEIDEEARTLVEDAARFAMDSPFPDEDEIRTDVFAERIEA